MMRKFLPLLFLIVLISSTKAQDDRAEFYHAKTCYSHELDERFLSQGNNREIYKARKKVYKEAARKYLLNRANKSTNAIRTISIVVHVVYNGSTGSTDVAVTDADINEIISILNEDYTRTNPDASDTRAIFNSVVGDAQLNFCLAQTDPSGNPTTGIVRVDTDEDYFDPDLESDEMKYAPGATIPAGATGTTGNGDPAWDPDTYMNIWICNITNGAGAGVAGYAYLPAAAGLSYDGLVLDSDIGVGPYGGADNRTATHEIGHYLGLQHTWADSPTCSVDDGFADTPESNYDQMDVYTCDPNATTPNSCDEGTGDLPDQYENYMSYASCQNMFSAEQVAYMNGVIDSDRSGIIDNGLCGTVVPLDADFTADITTANIGQTITFTNTSVGTGISTYDWDFDGSATAATPQTDNTSGPVAVTYNATGTYTVSLTIGDGTTTDTETKTQYITIVDPNALQFDFTGTPTTVVVGANVDFTSTVIANGPITTWNWTFTGADTPTSNAEFPTVTWSTIGDYDVSLMAYSASDTQTVTKTAYIHVIDSSTVPVANFQASQTTITPGTSIDYTNLSTNQSLIDSSLWILENADAPNNNITVAGAGNLAAVAYNTVPGHYDATLIIYCSLGNDTMYKNDYIYVIDPNNLDTVYANFKATTPRLIQQGWTVDFTDLSVGPVTNWHWEFEGGTPATFDGQYPPSITYNSTDGPFDVSLEVSNTSYADTASKPEYIVVITQWPWPDEDGFCENDLANMPKSEAKAAYHLTSNAGDWGYFPGHNYLKVKYYAEKFTNYTFDKIREIYVSPSRIQNNSQNYNEVKYYIWSVDSLTGMPGEILGSKKTYISDYTQDQYNPVVFDDPVEVSEEFYVGFYLKYPSVSSGEPQDTFAVYFSGNRPNGPNTTVCAKSTNNWMTPTQMLGDTLEISLNMRLKACIIKVNEIDYSNEVKLYPNPTKAKVTIELGDIPVINPDIKVYDITGRLINARITHTYGNNYELDLKSQQSGMYFVTFDFIDSKVTKKISLVK